MTKVEELRKRVLSVCFDTRAIDDIADLIVAAREEGAGPIKEAIRKRGSFLAEGENAALDELFDVIPLRNTGMFATVAACDCYVLPATVLVAAYQEGNNGKTNY